MDFEKVKTKLAEAYNATQNLQIQPTKDNIDILSLIMHNLDEAFGMLEEAQAEAAAKEEEKKEEE